MSALRRLRRSKAKHEGTFETSREKKIRIAAEKKKREEEREAQKAREAFEKMPDNTDTNTLSVPTEADLIKVFESEEK